MEKWQLKQMQELPLEVKIEKTKLRIREWYEHWDGQVYVSFSGGKDSTVLLHMVRELYPRLPAVFIDTGLEYPEIREFVKRFDEITTIRPKIKFTDVIANYGFPVVSKEVAKNIYYGRRALKNGNQHMYDIYINGIRHNKKTDKNYIFMPLAEKWKPLFKSDIPVSNKCCQIMKKDPALKYGKETGRHPFIGEMADDSRERERHYLLTGCNAFSGKKPISKPMGFWTEQDVLQYIKEFKLPMCPVYGEIVERDGQLYTTGVNRTGCMWCGFGVHLQESPNKFQQMADTHPKQYDYCINKLGCQVNDKFITWGDVLDFINVDYKPIVESQDSVETNL